jgi:protein-disulfide isomerase
MITTTEKSIHRHRRRLSAIGGLLAAAIVAVALAAAVSGRGSAFAGAPSGGRLAGVALASNLLAGIPQHGTILGRADAPVRIVEFADLQCPYCDEYALQALPTLVRDYVRTGKVQMQFETLSFIGPDSVSAGHVAAAAGQQDKLWNFVEEMYLNQGRENTGYATSSYLRRLLDAVPGLDVATALSAAQAPSADAALSQASSLAAQDGISATPSFLIGRVGGPLRQFQPLTLTAPPFAAAFDGLLGASQ